MIRALALATALSCIATDANTPNANHLEIPPVAEAQSVYKTSTEILLEIDTILMQATGGCQTASGETIMNQFEAKTTLALCDGNDIKSETGTILAHREIHQIMKTSGLLEVVEKLYPGCNVSIAYTKKIDTNQTGKNPIGLPTGIICYLNGPDQPPQTIPLEVETMLRIYEQTKQQSLKLCPAVPNQKEPDMSLFINS